MFKKLAKVCACCCCVGGAGVGGHEYAEHSHQAELDAALQDWREEAFRKGAGGFLLNHMTGEVDWVWLSDLYGNNSGV